MMDLTNGRAALAMDDARSRGGGERRHAIESSPIVTRGAFGPSPMAAASGVAKVRYRWRFATEHYYGRAFPFARASCASHLGQA